MNLEININGIEAEIEKPSVIRWRNWVWKSSILNWVELARYWTIHWVRWKWEAVFESKLLEKAQQYPLADIINCRFLDLEPIKKKQILLNLIDDKNIKKWFWKHWKKDIISSIDNVKKDIKDIKKNLSSTEEKIETYSDLRNEKEKK